MTSLYEDLLQEKPKVWLRAKRNRELRLEWNGRKVEIDEEDKLLTPEEIKRRRYKRQVREWRDRAIVKENQLTKEWNQKYWLDITRWRIYMGEQLWKDMAEVMNEAREEWNKPTPTIIMSEQEEKDYNFLVEHKADWLSLMAKWYFWVSWADGRCYESDIRDKWIIGRPIKLIPTKSLEYIYSWYLTMQKYVRDYLSEKAKGTHQTVEELVKENFKDEDINYLMRPYRWMVKPIRVPEKGSWLEYILKDIHPQKKQFAIGYIKMINEDKFMLGEVVLPFDTYLCGDYIYFPFNRCAIASMFWNWEFFNEENRALVHQWWRYMRMPATLYTIIHRIPVFKGKNMRLVKIPSVKIQNEDDNTTNNNSTYEYRLVPETKNIWLGFSPEKTLQDVIDKFKCPTYEECEYTLTRKMKPLTEELLRPRRNKSNMFYFDTSED